MAVERGEDVASFATVSLVATSGTLFERIF